MDTTTGQSPARRGGRPRGRFNPAIRWDLARELGAAGGLSLSEIAARVGTTKQNLHKQRHRWAAPESAAAALKLGRAEGDSDAAGDMSEQPTVRSRRDPATILETYIAQFADAVDAKAVRFDSVADLERAVRLLAFVRGEVESRKQTHSTISLEIMQERHRAARAYVGETVDDGVAGVLGRGVPAIAEGSAEELSHTA